jgi:group II intron reverse transcriptase/maturase
MELISSEGNIRLAYRNIKRNAGSITSGVDGKTIKDIEKLSAEKLVEIIQNKFRFYKPKAVRRKEIPKPNGKMRPLGIPTIVDRIVQQCILQVLEPICEAKFHERNNGFRPNRSAENALSQCHRMIQIQNLHFVVDIDIKGFFDNVNHSKLIRQIWAMGIQDKKLICVIKQMLKATIVMPDGTKIYPTKGTPQGGILSPLLANIVLNELDWWISSQWEFMPTHSNYKMRVRENGTTTSPDKFRAFRKTDLKEMYIVRYADDFKIFCRKRSDADKIFIAVKKWLKERLKLEISEEKSKVVNLKKKKSEFLGFELKAVRRRNKFVVESHMSQKAMKRVVNNLKEQIKNIQHCNKERGMAFEINYYNTMVVGIHNYYRFATYISYDCGKIYEKLRITIYNRLKQRITKSGTIRRKYIAEHYSKSHRLIFINEYPMIPISYIQTKFPLYKKVKICKYTPEGREEIYKTLKFDENVIQTMHLLAKPNPYGRSIEYMDNRVSLYAAQYGKCAVTGEILWIDEIHCHHKKPVSQGGTDEYKNLVIVHEDVHKLIHATKQETIIAYLSGLNLNKSQLQKLNKLRKMAGNPAI